MARERINGVPIAWMDEDELRAAFAKSKNHGLWMASDLDRFSLDELQTPPPRRTFLIDPLLPDGAATAFTGAGGSLKTTTVVAACACIAAGVDFLGFPTEPGPVLIITAEDRRDSVLRQVYANTRDFSDRQQREVSENLFVKDTVGTGFKLTRHVDGQTEVAVDVGQLIEYCRDIAGLRLVVFDTLSRLNGATESNEDLARVIEAMERTSVQTGASTLVIHHSGKAQMRADTNDQYSGRGGSSLSDNARSVMHIARVTADTSGAPTNAAKLIAEGRLLRLSHVKSNYASPAEDRYLERVQTPHAARLREFKPQFGKDEGSAAWERIAEWLATQKEVAYPTKATLEALGGSIGSRAQVRRALQWAEDRQQLIEIPHPDPKGGRKTYYSLPPAVEDGANAYRVASNGA